MTQRPTLALFTLALSTLAACTIQNWEGIDADPGTEGAPCADAEDCNPGLICSDLVCVDPAQDDPTCDGGHAPIDPGQGGADPGQGGAEPACIDDADCTAAEICDAGQCATPTCDAIDDEATCLDRTDCETVYAGVDCSCGQGCECQPGEPGCVCQSFEFFRCEAL